MASRLKQHISLDDFKLNHGRPSDFVHSVLFDSPLPYAIGVTCVTLHAVTMSVYSGVTSHYGVKIFIWLTYWSFFTLTARFVVTALNCWTFVACRWTIQRRGRMARGALDTREEDSAAMPTLYKAQWVLQNVSNCSALIVSALYWTVMYKPEKTESARSVNSHGINMLLVLCDLLLSRAPVRVHHFLHSVVFIALYILFSLLYWAAGGLNHKGEAFIYSLLDYSQHPGRAVVVFLAVAFVGAPLVHMLLYGVFRLRVCLATRLCWRQRGEEARRERTVQFQISADVDPSVDEKRNSCVNVDLDAAHWSDSGLNSDSHDNNGDLTGGYGCHGNGTVKSGLDNENDREPSLGSKPELRGFRPALNKEMSEVSCTDSTKGLLD